MRCDDEVRPAFDGRLQDLWVGASAHPTLGSPPGSMRLVCRSEIKVCERVVERDFRRRREGGSGGGGFGGGRGWGGGGGGGEGDATCEGTDCERFASSTVACSRFCFRCFCWEAADGLVPIKIGRFRSSKGHRGRRQRGRGTGEKERSGHADDDEFIWDLSKGLRGRGGHFGGMHRRSEPPCHGQCQRVSCRLSWCNGCTVRVIGQIVISCSAQP